MKVRRVTTGHSALGKAVVVNDTEVDADTVALLPGVEFPQTLGCRSAAKLPR